MPANGYTLQKNYPHRVKCHKIIMIYPHSVNQPLIVSKTMRQVICAACYVLKSYYILLYTRLGLRIRGRIHDLVLFSILRLYLPFKLNRGFEKLTPVLLIYCMYCTLLHYISCALHCIAFQSCLFFVMYW